MSDQELLERLRSGDSGAFDTIFRTWYAPLVRYVDAMLRVRADAEEIAQEVLLELWRRRDRLAEQGSVQAYLFQSARNRALNHVRHERVEQRAAPLLMRSEGVAARADAEVIEGEIADAIREAIESLPPRCREVFELSRIYGLKQTEIADALGVTVKAVEAQMARALRTMRERLAPWLPPGKTL
ncbi:MAG: RNA polymerase sigma-70 factor [Gemmatimonadaceae bacterium]|nr:RNA polymerase sigma-70 factor [Gemmatimonadaceae bacterium]